jgi:hypothetical protein
MFVLSVREESPSSNRAYTHYLINRVDDDGSEPVRRVSSTSGGGAVQRRHRYECGEHSFVDIAQLLHFFTRNMLETTRLTMPAPHLNQQRVVALFDYTARVCTYINIPIHVW